MRFSAPNEDVPVLSSGFSGQDMNGFVHCRRPRETRWQSNHSGVLENFRE